MISGLTALTVAVVLAAVIGRLSYGQALALGGATPAGAALVVGSTALPTFYAVALGAAAALALGVLRRRRTATRDAHRALPPGALLLLLFLVWSTVVTLAAPLIFNGMPVVHPLTTRLQAGVITSSNVAQIGYLALGIAVVVFLARSSRTRPQLLGLAIGATLLLSFARYLANQNGFYFPENFFDNSPSFNFIQTAPGGGLRVRGILSEPAALASTCVTGIAYFLARAAQVEGLHRFGCLALVVIALVLGVVSTSATFVVAGLITGAVLAAVAVFNFASRRYPLSLSFAGVVALSVVVLALVVPVLISFVQTTIDTKLGSSSYSDRTSSDTLSLDVFTQTYGFGVGLGSARASSFFPTLLSATGVIGTALFLAAIIATMWSARTAQTCRPVVYALVGLMIVKLTSAPDLSDPSGSIWIALGVLSHAALRRRSRDTPTPTADGRPRVRARPRRSAAEQRQPA